MRAAMSAAQALRVTSRLSVFTSKSKVIICCWKRQRRRPPPSWTHLRHKAKIVELLRPNMDGWSAEDWRLYFEESGGQAASNVALLARGA